MGVVKRILNIVAHPNLAMSQVNRVWIQSIQSYPEVTIHHLYEEYAYRPINVYRERELLLQHDRIVFQFPLYWYSTPAVLKQWQDEVLSYLWSKNEGHRLAGKELLLAVSIGDPQEVFQSKGFTIEEIMRPLELMAISHQITFLPIFAFFNASRANEEEIENSAKEFVQHIFSSAET